MRLDIKPSATEKRGEEKLRSGPARLQSGRTTGNKLPDWT
jgi:hypothetical protein